MKAESKKEYTTPQLVTLGNVQVLTQERNDDGSGPPRLPDPT